MERHLYLACLQKASVKTVACVLLCKWFHFFDTTLKWITKMQSLVLQIAILRYKSDSFFENAFTGYLHGRLCKGFFF